MDPETPVADVAPAPTPPAVPAVVAVVVTHDPGSWFDETLRSFADQTYPDLSVLVVDTGSAEDPTDRVHAVLPDARVHRLEADDGYGTAANVVLDAVDGAAFYAFCHDDIALEPDTLRTMVEEAFRSNAGIVGPKLVDWHDPRRLLQAGMGVDKTGVMAPIAEPGELDQEQHDAVRDVFAVSGGCMVVRADLFAALDGFDPGIDRLGEDVDLCWRAHVVGARVLIAPAARVRHLEALAERQAVDERRRRFARHRLRTTMVAYGRFHRWRVLPQAALLTVLEALYAFVSGRPDQARDVLTAWTWNLRRRGQIRRRRAQLATVRRVKDKEIRDLQVRGSARFNAFVRGQFRGNDDRVATFSRSSRDVVGAMRDGSRQLTGAFALLLVIILVVSSRGLVLDGIPAIGELSRFPDGAGTIFSRFWSGWRPGGLGDAGSQPTAFGLLGLLSYGFFGANGILRAVLIIGTIPVGAIGAWRLARPIGSARASVASFAVYLALPVPYNALARGSWSGLLLYAASPWLLLLLGRASGIAPFGPVHAERGERSADSLRRRPVSLILGLGLLIGIVGAFVPFVVVIVAALVLALTAGSLFCFRVAGVLRLLAVAALAIVVAFALNLPWSLDLVSGDHPWRALVGGGSGTAGALDLGRILRFETGPWGAPPLGFAFLLAAGLPIIIGRSWRLEWAVRAWFVVLAGWATLWAAEEGHLTVGLPAAEVILAPVAAALAFTAALGLAAFETDLRAYRFGWRQVLSVVAALGVVLGALPLGSGLLDGRWQTPHSDFVASYGALAGGSGRGGAARVLWLGDADIVPAAGWRYDQDVAYAATDGGVPTVLDRFASDEPGATPLLAKAVRLADQRRTNRLGHLLAPMGVRYIVVTERLAPSSDRGAVPVPARLTAALDQQLDLRQIPVRDGITVYENAVWASERSVLPSVDGARTSFTDAVGQDLSDAVPVLTSRSGSVGARGTVAKEGDLLVASTSDEHWQLRIDGVPMHRSTTYGWANQFAATRTGPATLTFDTPLSHTLAGAGQIVLWLAVVVVRRRSRLAERRADLAAKEATP